MQSGIVEPDEAAVLMMAVCKELNVKHRLIFVGDKSDLDHLFYRCEFQVAEACDRTGWITVKDLPALVVWLAQKR